MDNLFSHAAPDADDTPEPAAADGLDPVVYSVTVPGAVARAFVGFTEHTHLWWPLEEHGVFGAGSYVEFEENLILETADDGRTAVWGRSMTGSLRSRSMPAGTRVRRGLVHGVARRLPGR